MATSAEELSGQAEQLKLNASFFKIDQGTQNIDFTEKRTTNISNKPKIACFTQNMTNGKEKYGQQKKYVKQTRIINYLF